MLRPLLASLLLALILPSCAPAAPSPTPQVIDVYASAAVQPWLPDLYACAERQSAVVRLVDTASEAEVQLRIGQPQDLASPAYQIDKEDILIVTNRESPVQNLTLDEARALFAGLETDGADVWVFDPAEDVQQVFDHEVMQGTQVTSQARLAASPQQMSDTLNNDTNAVGILPRHWMVGTTRDVFTIPDVPVLAIVGAQPAGVVKSLLTCLQK